MIDSQSRRLELADDLLLLVIVNNISSEYVPRDQRADIRALCGSPIEHEHSAMVGLDHIEVHDSHALHPATSTTWQNAFS